MTHHHFRLQSADSFQCNADNDQDRCTTHCQRAQVAVEPGQGNREDCDNSQEECAHQSDL